MESLEEEPDLSFVDPNGGFDNEMKRKLGYTLKQMTKMKVMGLNKEKFAK